MFFYKRVSGGWFASDRVFLVGLTIQEIIAGKASTTFIDEAVSKSMKE